MTARDRAAWLAAFPEKHNEGVVSFLVETFQRLAAMGVQTFQYGLPETAITITLGRELENTAEKAGFSGLWSYEMQQGSRDPITLKPIRSGRTDIRFFSDLVGLDLIFEFKKLADNTYDRTHYAGPEGIGRFVDKGYGKNSPIGYMVALMEYRDPVALVKLENRIEAPEICILLKTDGHPSVIRRPSAVCAKHARFDTRHGRVPGSSRFISIDLGHMVLVFNNGSRPAGQLPGKTKRRRGGKLGPGLNP